MSPLERNQSQFPRRHALMCVCVLLCLHALHFTTTSTVCMQLDTYSMQLDGRTTCRELNSQARQHVSFSCKNSNAFHLVQHRLRDLYKCLYTPCFMYSHTYTTMGIIERVLQQMPSTVYHLNLQKTEAFILKVPHMYFHFWISNVHARRSL